MPLRSVQPDLYRIELPTVLSDSTHGQICHFELITVRIQDDEGAEGLGYTYTVGAGGRAIRALIEHELKPWLEGRDGTRIEQLWKAMWWRLHFVGRAGSPPSPWPRST
jgi:L-alanine-DL-glutamate epimerase-like enolase superfamily enzyme